MTHASGLFSLTPRIHNVGDKLVAETTLLGWLLSLTLMSRRVEVDPRRKQLRVTNRYVWFFNRVRRIPFRAVKAIYYEYSDMNPQTLLGSSGDTIDSYRVGLVLQDEERVHLFRFVGAGSYQRGVDQHFVWQVRYGVDVTGTQEGQARGYVSTLQHLLGVPMA